jgi:DNA-directed RNA polymerase specialized sigma24 family protein
MLRSCDRAEDAAQEMFLTFGRSSVPAGEAAGWLSVAAGPTPP